MLSNYTGQLGTNDTINRSTPVTTFAGGTDWVQISSGDFFRAAIKEDGTLWTWGSNTFFGTGTGPLGVNDTFDRSTPVTTFAGGTDWKQVSCGGQHAAAIKTDGTLWAWGSGFYGQLGNNVNLTYRSTPITTFAGGNDWEQVSCGSFHTAAIKTDGTLWTWGFGTQSQLGTNDAESRSTPVTTFAGGTNWNQVSGGWNHTSAIKTDGTLWIWGRGSEGQLGTNDTNIYPTPITTFAGGNNWESVKSGIYYTSAIKTDGTLWLWGRGDSGELGTNDTINRSTPVTTFAGGTNWLQVSSGENHTAAIKADGTLWTWGYGYDGQLGNNLTFQRNTPITTFAGGTNWRQISCGFRDTSAIISEEGFID